VNVPTGSRGQQTAKFGKTGLRTGKEIYNVSHDPAGLFTMIDSENDKARQKQLMFDEFLDPIENDALRPGS